MCDECDWEAYMDTIDDLLGVNPTSAFLNDVADWVDDRKHITERQAEVVDRMAREADL